MLKQLLVTALIVGGSLTGGVAGLSEINNPASANEISTILKNDRTLGELNLTKNAPYDYVIAEDQPVVANGLSSDGSATKNTTVVSMIVNPWMTGKEAYLVNGFTGEKHVLHERQECFYTTDDIPGLIDENPHGYGVFFYDSEGTEIEPFVFISK